MGIDEMWVESPSRGIPEAVEAQVVVAFADNNQCVSSRGRTYQVKHLEDDRLILEHNRASHEEPCECFMLHEQVPARFFDHHLLIHPPDLVQKRERVELGAIKEDALWLGPLWRGDGHRLVGLRWVLVLL